MQTVQQTVCLLAKTSQGLLIHQHKTKKGYKNQINSSINQVHKVLAPTRRRLTTRHLGATCYQVFSLNQREVQSWELQVVAGQQLGAWGLLTDQVFLQVKQ